MVPRTVDGNTIIMIVIVVMSKIFDISMVDAYFRTKTCLGDAANRQQMYYDRDTTPRHFMKGDWVIYWHKPTAMLTLSSGWTDPFVVTEKVSVVDRAFKSGTC